MARPWIWSLVLVLPAAAYAGGEPSPGFSPPQAPFLLGSGVRRPLAGHPTALHVPQPFPDGEELQLQGEGASPWLVGGGLLAGGAAVAGFVAVAAHARSLDPEADPARVETLQKRRNTAGYTAMGLAGGAGVCVVLNRVW